MFMRKLSIAALTTVLIASTPAYAFRMGGGGFHGGGFGGFHGGGFHGGFGGFRGGGFRGGFARGGFVGGGLVGGALLAAPYASSCGPVFTGYYDAYGNPINQWVCN
jgi:hypothetical protein